MSGNHPSNAFWIKKKKMVENKMSEIQLSFVVLKADRPRLISVNFVMVGLEKVVSLGLNYSRDVCFSFQCMLDKVGNWNFDIFLFDRLTNGK